MSPPENQRLLDFAQQAWDRHIVPALQDYIRIPAKSPMFDAAWETHRPAVFGVAYRLLGSVADRVLRHAPCPVLVVPARRTWRTRNPLRALDWTLELCGKARSVALVHRRAEFRAQPASVARMKELAAASRLRHLEGTIQALAAVGIVLLLGLWNMMRGGSPNTSQLLMRWRVVLQFIALCLVMAAIYLAGRG